MLAADGRPRGSSRCSAAGSRVTRARAARPACCSRCCRSSPATARRPAPYALAGLVRHRWRPCCCCSALRPAALVALGRATASAWPCSARSHLLALLILAGHLVAVLLGRLGEPRVAAGAAGGRRRGAGRGRRRSAARAARARPASGCSWLDRAPPPDVCLIADGCPSGVVRLGAPSVAAIAGPGRRPARRHRRPRAAPRARADRSLAPAAALFAVDQLDRADLHGCATCSSSRRWLCVLAGAGAGPRCASPAALRGTAGARRRRPARAPRRPVSHEAPGTRADRLPRRGRRDRAPTTAAGRRHRLRAATGWQFVDIGHRVLPARRHAHRRAGRPSTRDLAGGFWTPEATDPAAALAGHQRVWAVVADDLRTHQPGVLPTATDRGAATRLPGGRALAGQRHRRLALPA